MTDLHILLAFIQPTKVSHFKICILRIAFANNQHWDEFSVTAEKNNNNMIFLCTQWRKQPTHTHTHKEGDCICSIQLWNIMTVVGNAPNPFFRSMPSEWKNWCGYVCVEKMPLKQCCQPSHDAKCNLSIFRSFFSWNIIQRQPSSHNHCTHYVSILNMCVCVRVRLSTSSFYSWLHFSLFFTIAAAAIIIITIICCDWLDISFLAKLLNCYNGISHVICVLMRVCMNVCWFVLFSVVFLFFSLFVFGLLITDMRIARTLQSSVKLKCNNDNCEWKCCVVLWWHGQKR